VTVGGGGCVMRRAGGALAGFAVAFCVRSSSVVGRNEQVERRRWWWWWAKSQRQARPLGKSVARLISLSCKSGTSSAHIAVHISAPRPSAHALRPRPHSTLIPRRSERWRWRVRFLAGVGWGWTGGGSRRAKRVEIAHRTKQLVVAAMTVRAEISNLCARMLQLVSGNDSRMSTRAGSSSMTGRPQTVARSPP